MDNHYTVGIDLGGTRVKIGLVRDQELFAFSVIQAEANHGLKSNLPRIEAEVNRLIREYIPAGAAPEGVGLAFPGLADHKAGKVLSTNKKYDDALKMDLAGWAAAAWGTGFYIDNDARMAAVGEWKFGAGQGSDDLVMMTIGTGIGTSAIINGQLLRGKHFQAGCLGGHFTVAYEGAICTCGNIGCVEAQASTGTLPDKIKSSREFHQSLLSRWDHHDFTILFQAAQQNDPLARRIVDECLNVWSAGIINLIHAYDPELIILGGGILNSKEDILPGIRQRVDQHAWTPWGKVEIRPSKLMERAGVLGVAYCLTHQS